jgi:hypothetical protein
VVAIADMPDENSSAASASSKMARRSSTISEFGWLKRE